MTSDNWTVTLAHWSRDQKTLTRLRREVFMNEQGVPEADEWDGRDASAHHFVLYDADHAMGCARIVIETQRHRRCLHIGRVAIEKRYRGQGAGRRLMQGVLDWCFATWPEAAIELDAQLSVIGFYENLGFSARGPVFIDAGIEHRTMRWHG